MTDRNLDQGPTTIAGLAPAVTSIADDFAAHRSERQRWRELSRADFDRLRDAGLLRASLPIARGGLWESGATSTRPLAELFRTLAHGDSSVALVASMHQAVISAVGWQADTQAPEPYAGPWEAQKEWVFDTVRNGHWWSTIVSEPGSGGDATRTQSLALQGAKPDQYLISGLKHFGSGTGIASYVITSAIPDGESDYDTFFFDMRGIPLDGSRGVRLVAPWDGHGMIATHSHALQFDKFPATRIAWPHRPPTELAGGSPLWPAIITGIVETAMATARHDLQRRGALRPYEQVAWTRAEADAWLIEQAYEGLLRAVEQADPRRGLAKLAIAELAESTLQRLCRIMGGSSYGRHSPYGHWYEDVRALGFLRPPWGLAYDNAYSLGAR